MASAIQQLRADLKQIDDLGLTRRLAGPLPPGTVSFCSNDYLGLASDPSIAAAARAALLDQPLGPGAARLVGADSALHRRLEEDLARFKGAPAALLFSCGYQANVGCLAALLGPDDVVFSDALNHASIIDGCRLSRARIAIYRHLDSDDLGRQLAAARGARRRLIVTDAIFGMDGDRAPLTEIAALGRRYDALLMLDEAHATGVLGPGGRGLAAQLETPCDLQVTTFGKALGVFGAGISGSQPLIDYLINRARTFVFTTALPPALCAAGIAALQQVCSPAGDALRARLRDNVDRLRRGLAALGYPVRDDDTPIQPLILGDPQTAVATSAALLEAGYFVQAIRPPTVPAGTSRLRFALSAAHRAEQIDGLLATLEQLLPRVPLARTAEGQR